MFLNFENNPMRNVYIESFNGRFRDACLNTAPCS
ncbi:MAG: transposase [Nitrosospira sp.]|nr:transposase [Nitrosospira sp.]